MNNQKRIPASNDVHARVWRSRPRAGLYSSPNARQERLRQAMADCSGVPSSGWMARIGR